jgi:hypothetical protein
VSFKINGLDELQKRLKSLSQVETISLGEVLTPAFVASCSRFSNVQELFDASGFQIHSTEDLKLVPDDQWDKYISDNTTFPDWLSMQKEAHREWLAGKLNG